MQPASNETAKDKKRRVFQPGPRPRGPRALFLEVSVQRRRHPGEMRDNLPARLRSLCARCVSTARTQKMN